MDSAGAAYIAGSTSSTDFPVTANAFQKQNVVVPDAIVGSSSTAFVAKFDPTGANLSYSTYLGGTAAESASAITVTAARQAVVAGSTYSANFPVTGGVFQSVFRGTPTAFVTKLSADGSGLVFSTFLGGSGGDRAYAVAADAGGNVYAGGASGSSDFPVTSGAFESKPQFQSGASGFVAKLNASGTALLYSTWFNGGAVDAIALDTAGDAFVAGSSSAGLPVLNAFQSDPSFLLCAQIMGGSVIPDGYIPCPNGFVSALNPSGSSLVFSTWLDSGPTPNVFSTNGAAVNALALDSQGALYVGGGGSLSMVADGPGPSTGTAFLLKLNTAGTPPKLTAAAVTNSASFAQGLVQPGGLATIFVSGLKGVQGTVAATPGAQLPVKLSGVSVSIGGIPAPLLAVVDNGSGTQQINLQVPFEVAPLSGLNGYSVNPSADVVVSQASAGPDYIFASETAMNWQTSAPGIFLVDANGTPAIQHASNYSLVSASNPAAPGEALVLYATGLGAVAPAVPDGAPAPLSPLSYVQNAPVLTVGGNAAKILFAGLTPTLTGLYQIDFIVPAGVASGSVPVVLSLPAVSVYEAFAGIFRYQVVPASNSVVLAIR